MHKLASLIRHPAVTMGSGFILMASGLAETIETIRMDVEAGGLQAHHGVTLFGFVIALRSLVDILEGAEMMGFAEDEEEEADKK